MFEKNYILLALKFQILAADTIFFYSTLTKCGRTSGLRRGGALGICQTCGEQVQFYKNNSFRIVPFGINNLNPLWMLQRGVNH